MATFEKKKPGYTQQYQDYLNASQTTAPQLNTAQKQADLNNYLSTLKRGQIGTNKYQNQYEQAYNALANRGKFNYSQSKDPLYQQYEDMYTRNAKLAMQDTVGQISALTGGYGNSYAETAGQAMYNQAMAGLNEKSLELYNAAMDRYNMEGQQLANAYNAAAQMYGNEQNRLAEEAYFTEQQYQTDAQRAMAMYQDELDRAAWEWTANEQQRQADIANRYKLAAMQQADYQYDTSLDYQQYRDEIGDEQWQKQFDSNEYWKQAEMDYNNYWNQQNLDLQKEAMSWDKEKWTKEFNQSVADGDWQKAYALMELQQKDSQFNTEMAYKNKALAQDASLTREGWAHDSSEAALNRQYNSSEAEKDRALSREELAEKARQHDSGLAYDYWNAGQNNALQWAELNSGNDYRDRALNETIRSNKASEALSQQQIDSKVSAASKKSASAAEATINRNAGAPTSNAASKVDSKIKSPTAWSHSNDKNFDTYQEYASAQIQSAYEKGDIDANDVKWLLTRYNIA